MGVDIGDQDCNETIAGDIASSMQEDIATKLSTELKMSSDGANTVAAIAECGTTVGHHPYTSQLLSL